jgi:hypothetical protein
MAIGTLLVFGSIVPNMTTRSPVWADEDQKVANSDTTTATALTAIKISSGQLLSRALLLDPSLLINLKQVIKNNKNDPVLHDSLEQLLLQANSFLTIKPRSVIEKTELPSSGDKHDLLSLRPYDWPDPKKPNGLPYIHHDGRVNPEVYSIPDKKNLDDMIYRVKILSLAYYLTDNSHYASKAEGLLRVWFLNNNTRMNPNLQQAEMKRGLEGGTASGIMLGKNLPDVADAIRLIKSSNSWSAQDQQGMQLWFSKYLDWLLNSDHGKKESRRLINHGTWYYVQVSSIALFLNKTDIAKSILQGFIEHNNITKKIQPDGRQPMELKRINSLDYSIFNLLGLFKLASVGQHLGIDLWNYTTSKGAGLQKALDYLLPYVEKQQTWPHSQVEPINGKNLVDLLCRAAIYYKNNQSYIQACKSASTKQIDISRTFPP